MTTFFSEICFSDAANDCDVFDQLICKSNSRTLLKRNSEHYPGVEHYKINMLALELPSDILTRNKIVG